MQKPTSPLTMETQPELSITQMLLNIALLPLAIVVGTIDLGLDRLSEYFRTQAPFCNSA
ncbi:MAG: hypothetical protein JWP09_430 [Candidatus Taylorbacteria bacterium]|nr:hypothetical protein [Candidatus Taylorbacteria bacterium]